MTVSAVDVIAVVVAAAVVDAICIFIDFPQARIALGKYTTIYLLVLFWRDLQLSDITVFYVCFKVFRLNKNFLLESHYQINNIKKFRNASIYELLTNY